MRILLLTNYANGLWLFRKELLLAFMEDGHEVSVSLPPDENADKLRALSCQNKKINLIETPFERRGSNPVKDLGLFMTYLRLLKQERPDVVLTYTIKPNLYGGLACRLKRIPYLCNITGLGTAIEDGGVLSRLLLRFYKISMKKARCVFFQNLKNKEFMVQHGIAAHNHKMLPGSGVNLKEHPLEEYPSEEKGIVFLAVIRIMKDKGVAEYLEAARIMRDRYENVRFKLVGEYEEETREYYEPQLKELTQKDILQYLGHIEDVGAVMAQSHVIVHPSYHEGLSNVLLEAAACGRPVLASNVSGCVETFIEGESGFAFAAKSTDALVAAMEKILAMSHEERRDMGISGRAWVEKRFDRAIVIQTYREQLLSLSRVKNDARG